MVRLSRRNLLAVAAGWVAAAAFVRPSSAANDDAVLAAARVEELIENGLVLLRDTSLTPAGRVARFRTLFDKYFAVDAIARWVLGRYWKQATAEQQAQYRKLFEDLITYGYVKRFGEYGGQTVRILGTTLTADNAVTVNAEIAAPAGGAPLLVDWRVGVRDGSYLITDVIVANVSLAQTWRSDFAASIQQQGGSIDAFLAVLRERIAELKAEVEGSSGR